jgi:RNA polymerase sigma factor (sigma-70 family)
VHATRALRRSQWQLFPRVTGVSVVARRLTVQWRQHEPTGTTVTLVSKVLPPGEMSALLVDIAATRDRQKFAQLFEYYAPRMKAYLMRQGADGALAEELAQEAMLIVWRKAESFDPAKASAATWIYTIVRNLRIDALRKMRRPAFDVDDPAFVPDPPQRPDEAMLSDQLERRVKQALSTLPEEQAVVVRLSFFEDKAHGEIATELSLPLGTVKSRLRLAMRRLQPLLGD